MFPCKDITLNNSLGNTIIFPSQRLVTMSASLRTQTGLHCLILQVLNIKSLFPNCLNTILFTSVVTNLEHGLVTLTESFSPLESELHNLPCWSPKQKCALSYAIPFYTMYTTTWLNWFSPASASHSQPVRLTWSANCLAGNSHWDADVIYHMTMMESSIVLFVLS